jgi:hypothetical protein
MKKYVLIIFLMFNISISIFGKSPCLLLNYSSGSSNDTFFYHDDGSLHRMESKVHRGANKYDTYTYEFFYGVAHQITEAHIIRNGTVPNRDNSFIGDTEKYQWENGKLIKVEGFFNNKRAYVYLLNYDISGNITQLSIEPFGKPKFVGKYEYDAQNNPIKISFSYGNELIEIIEQEFADNTLKAPVQLLTEQGLPFHPMTGAVWEKRQMTAVKVFTPNGLGKLRLTESGKLLDKTTNPQGYVTAFTYQRNTYQEQRNFLLSNCK